MRDLRGWKTGEVAWPDLTRTLLLYGPPGTGKSWIARAMGNSAGFSVVTGTFGEWQAAGHLGDMLREMRRTFRDARTKAPSVGTCNHPDLIDPAVLRAGRFDMKVSLPLPDAEGLFSVFRHCLPDWREADLRDLAARAVGCSAADVDAVIRQTQTMARGQKRDMTLDDLHQIFRLTHDADIDRRVALHECGHAIACAPLRLGPVRRIFLGRDGGGGTVFDANAKHGLLSDMQDRLVQLLAGRAAERLILGDVSAGAGGSADSDLAMATAIASGIQMRYGLGGHGPVWTADPETLLALDPDMLFRVRRELEAAEKRAVRILSVHRNLLEEMAEALMASRDMDRAEVQDWLARVDNAAPDEDRDARPAPQPQ
ncbi:AAA family ATPase [Paracoccus versutus]|uniref:AAA family ATPase n=1 Tax=Paracoccus versutus TaxID=34007 RepID=UPI001FCB208C|nr:AAA family ATPase [Paracoccus versutus]